MSELSPLWISLKISTVAGLLTCALGVTVAYGMAGYHGKRKSLIDGLLLLPLVLPPTVIGFVLLQLLSQRGVVGSFLNRFNLSLVFTWQGGVVAAAIVTFPLVYRTALAAFEQIDPHILAAARSLGASEWRVFRTVALPLAQRGILAGTLLAWARGLGEFGATLMVAGNIPGRTATIPLAIYTAVETGDTAAAWRWSGVILSLALAAIATLNLWHSPRHPRSQSHSPFTPHPSPLTLHPSPLTVNLHHPLPDFDLTVKFVSQPGAIAVLGASGAGKSMLLRLIAGLEQPAWGRITLNEQVLCDRDRHILQPSQGRRVGIVFQNYALFPHLTVAENITFGLRHELSKREQLQRISALLAQVHLPGIEQRYPHQLSGGQQQRVALVRALASEPDLLLLDEPFSALDPYLCRNLEQELAAVLQSYRGITLLVTHRQDLAYRLCPRWLVLDRGQVVADGSREELWQQPRSLALAQLLGCENITPVEQLDAETLHLSTWGYSLKLAERPDFPVTHVGLRANTLGQSLSPHPLPDEPTLRCWLVRRDSARADLSVRTPEQVIFWLKFHQPPQNDQDYDVQASLSLRQWQQWQNHPCPWFIGLEPSAYLLLHDNGSSG